jgi:hypothetical protein
VDVDPHLQKVFAGDSKLVDAFKDLFLESGDVESLNSPEESRTILTSGGERASYYGWVTGGKTSFVWIETIGKGGISEVHQVVLIMH